MPIATFRYHISEDGDHQAAAPLTQRTCQSFMDAWKAEELLWLRYSGGCEVFIVPGNRVSAKKVTAGLQQAGVLPGGELPAPQFSTGKDAVVAFLMLAVGARGASGGIKLLELLHREYARASEWGLIGAVLNRLFQRGIWLHEKVRQETPFFDFAVDPALVIHDLCRKILDFQHDIQLTVAGFSPSLLYLVEALHGLGYQQVTLLGNKGEWRQHPPRIDADIRTAESLDSLPARSDVLIIFPSATHRLTDELLRKRMRQRANAPLLVFDFAASNLDLRKLNRITDLYIYSGADLEKIIRYNENERQNATDEMLRWIDREVDAFYDWYHSEERCQFSGIIGATPQMQRIFEMVSRIARTDITVLIDGESGTGKELVARAVHQLSARSKASFLVINCGAIPESLLESELFGHVKGAFTGAIAGKKGLFEAADSGTIFLDEIGELPQHLQVKLLRVLQDGEIKRVGSTDTLQVDVRVLAATNKDLAKMVEDQQFRSDLYYRLNVIQLTLPPLRERRADIPYLVKHFIRKYDDRLHKDVQDISPEALDVLHQYQWPGNVRELENALERAVALSLGSTITVDDLPPVLLQAARTLPQQNGKLPAEQLTLKQVEKQHIIETLHACEWNYELASKRLGIGRTTLWRKLKEYDMLDKS